MSERLRIIEPDPDTAIADGRLLRAQLLAALAKSEQPKAVTNEQSALAPRFFSILRTELARIPHMIDIFDNAIGRGKFNPDEDVTAETIQNVIDDATTHSTPSSDLKALRMIWRRYSFAAGTY